MKVVAIVRPICDPRDVEFLFLEDGVLRFDRTSASLNEGDIKAITLTKGAVDHFDALSVGTLSNKFRAHTFVRGANEIYEVGEAFARVYEEGALAKTLAEQIKNLGATLVVCGSKEQDTGRGLLAGALAANLGYELFVNVKKITKHEGGVLIEQQLDHSVQQYLIKGSAVICADDTCDLGDDPDSAYDLMEKFEKKESKKVMVDASVLKQSMAVELPPAPVAHAAVNHSAEVVQKVTSLIKPFMN